MAQMTEILTEATSDKEAVRLVSDASIALAFGGLGDFVWGHASIRDHLGRGIWMKGAGWGFEEITDERVQLISWNGQVLEGTGPRHIEFHIHTEIYRARPDVGAVVHAHSDTVNAWCSLGVPLNPLTHGGTLFGETALVRFTRTANLIRTPELGRDLASSMGEAPLALIPHHGFVIAREDIASAVMRAVLLERACRTQLTAMSAGTVRSWISEDELSEFSWPSNQVRAGWEYLVRRARSTYPPND